MGLGFEPADSLEELWIGPPCIFGCGWETGLELRAWGVARDG